MPAPGASEPVVKTRIPLGVWWIGLAMFLVNTSSVMVYSLFPVYLKTTLGVATGWIGLLEGITEGTAYATKLLSGIFSDYLRRRKMIMGLGYFFVTLSRLFMAISGTYGAVFIGRMFDRLGNGIQATPRDALISDIAPPQTKGACFGLRQSLGTAGSFFGGIVAIAAMIWTVNNFHQVFWLAAIPAILAFVILLIFVREPAQNLHPADQKKRYPLHLSDIPRLGRTYWLLMLVVACFMLARVGEAFLVIHAHKNFGLKPEYAPLVHILYNATYALSSYPVGWLSDRFSRYILLGLGIASLIITDVILATANSLPLALFGIALWGIQMGVSQAMFSALIADNVPKDLRGTGFGFFYLISALSIVIAGVTAGQLADVFGEWASFAYSTCLALVSLIILSGIRLRWA